MVANACGYLAHALTQVWVMGAAVEAHRSMTTSTSTSESFWNQNHELIYAASSWGSMKWPSLPKNTSRGHPGHMPTTSQLALLDQEEKRLVWPDWFV